MTRDGYQCQCGQWVPVAITTATTLLNSFYAVCPACQMAQEESHRHIRQRFYVENPGFPVLVGDEK